VIDLEPYICNGIPNARAMGNCHQQNENGESYLMQINDMPRSGICLPL